MEKICANCFAKLKGNVCTECGYDTESAMPEQYALAVGTVLKKRYLIGKVIGKGGFGITYLTYDMQLEKAAAVKEYFPKGMAVRGADNTTVEVLAREQQKAFSEGMEKMYREAELLSLFSECEDILSIFDVFKENGTAYYVMEFIHGITLKEYISENGKITSGQAVYILRKALTSLTVIHKGDMIHRDISPENIMLCTNGAVKLVDFGAARQVFPDSGDSLSVILKPGYAPLEQYQRKGNQGAWTDIYSLALSVYCGLTLSIPDDPMTRMDDDSTFTENLSDIPPQLAAVIKKAAELRYENRYKSADEMLAELNSCGIAEERINVKEMTALSENVKKPYKKRKRRKLITAVIVAAAAVIIAIPAAIYYKENYAKPESLRIGDVYYPREAETLDLSDLELTNASIANLKHFKNLRKLNLSDNYITDLSVLEGLDKLENLNFNNNNVSDISFAYGMDNLVKISAENSGVYDLSPLKGKTKLKEAFFGNSYVTDATPLSDSRELEKIGFNEMQIGDLEAFRGMEKLEMVCLSGCNISDISPLSDSHGLKYVYIGRNNVSDLSPLKNCDEIYELFIDNNPINNSLETFEGITVNGYVTIDSNGITAEEAQMVYDSMNGDFILDY